MKCTSMKQILALLSWGLKCNPKEPEAFTFAKMEVGHPVCKNLNAGIVGCEVNSIVCECDRESEIVKQQIQCPTSAWPIPLLSVQYCGKSIRWLRKFSRSRIS